MNRFNGLCKVCSERRYRQVCISRGEKKYLCASMCVRVAASLGEVYECLWAFLLSLVYVCAVCRVLICYRYHL